ncbi:hypothetical protein CEXT_576481 [Caerostris extrusa]|uniref:Uncharacterized protein n=1 Tax=Caerostris extrusa TaxID=172846 RepID=A0AAV4VW53_CAEEX|nr:hypothetical protein CEXT_576481 [Caerostris extrusa]
MQGGNSIYWDKFKIELANCSLKKEEGDSMKCIGGHSEHLEPNLPIGCECLSPGIAIQEGESVWIQSRDTWRGKSTGKLGRATIFLLDYRSCNRHSLGCAYFQFLTNDLQNRLKRISF